MTSELTTSVEICLPSRVLPLVNNHTIFISVIHQLGQIFYHIHVSGSRRCEIWYLESLAL